MKSKQSSVLKTSRVSIIIPAHEMNAAFVQCAEAVRRLNPAPLEFIVVVDGGNEKVCSIATDFGATVRTTPSTRGPAAARNVGARVASGDILFFIDSDVTVPPDAVKRLQSIFSTSSAPDAIIGSYDTVPPHENFLSQYKNLVQHFVHQDASRNAYTFWGACGAIKRQVFLDIGGFDERYDKPSIEDIELGYRLRDNGYAILLCKTLQVTHLKKWTATRLFHSDFFCRAVPWSRLIFGAKRMDNDLNINRATRIKVLLTYLLSAHLPCIVISPFALASATGIATVLLLLDWKLLRFFCHRRGALFAARVPVWQWFYYAYSGFAFGMVAVEELLGKRPKHTKEGWPAHWKGVL